MAGYVERVGVRSERGLDMRSRGVHPRDRIGGASDDIERKGRRACDRTRS
jgi:hypothetical protein